MAASEPPPTFSIRRFFAGKNVLLTGATGFLARALAEKLLRSLPGVGSVHLLIRPRVRGDGSTVAPETRLVDEVLASSVFDRLRREWGRSFERRCLDRIVCVPGDLTHERLGLDPEAYADLAGRIDVVIGSAATVVFDERLDLALEVNTLSPLRLLELARDARAAYVHISTAYVSARQQGRIPERLLEPLEAIAAQLPKHAKVPDQFDVRSEIARLQELCRRIEVEADREAGRQGEDPFGKAATARKRRLLIEAGMERARALGWNDTYTFTKYLGEQLVRLEQGDVPTVIVRPSIIESCLQEPEPGWLDGLRMADPLIIGFGKGRLPDFPGGRDAVIDLIPADFVVNGVLAAAAQLERPEHATELIHVASSAENPLSFGELYDFVRDYFRRHPLRDRNGKPVRVGRWSFPDARRFRQKLTNIYLRPLRLANRLIDGPVPATKRFRTKLRSAGNNLEQLLYYVDIYGPYTALRCTFENDRARQLLLRLDPAERSEFDFDPKRIRWRDYIEGVHVPGLKRHVLRIAANGDRDLARVTEAADRTAPLEEIHEVLAREHAAEETALELDLGPEPAVLAEATAEAGMNGGHGSVAVLPARRARRARLVQALARETELAPDALLGRSPVQKALQRSFGLFAKLVLRGYLKLESCGLDQVPSSGPYILASNHSSHLDTAVIREVLGRGAAQLCVMAARDYFFDTRLKSWLFSTLFNTLPFDRDDPFLRGLGICRRVLERGRALLIYPEGTRSPTGHLQRFKPGIGILALELAHPVIPVHITGTFQSLPRGKTLPRPSKVRIRFGAPVDVSELARRRRESGSFEAAGGRISRLYREAATRIRDAVANLADLP